jgi:phage tail sheath protein FI
MATFGKPAAGMDLGFAIDLYFRNGGRRAVVVRVPDLRLAEIAGDPAGRRGMFALDSTDEIGLLVIPGVHDPLVWDAVTTFGRERRLFAIFDPPAEAGTATEIEDFVVQSGARTSDRAALYAPWLVVPDPVNGTAREVPPSGAVAGIYARFDEQFGVWKSPAGVDAAITGITGLTASLSEQDLAALGDIGVNGLRSLPGGGDVVWGAKTFHGHDGFTAEARFVPVRRLTLYLEASISRGVAWAVFEPNDEPLWQSIRVQVEAFLDALWRDGAFAGQRPDDAFFVRCDATTMTQVDVDRGILRILVGFAPLRPAEFVIVEIQQQTAT